jgi:hypothetical protein
VLIVDCGIQRDIELLHEFLGRGPVFLANDQNRLQPVCLTVSECECQLGAGLAAIGSEPLFELVDNDQEPAAFGEPGAFAEPAENGGKWERGRDLRKNSAELSEQVQFSVIRRGFKINPLDVGRQLRQESGADKGCFPTTAAAVDQSDGCCGCDALWRIGGQTAVEGHWGFAE